MVILPLPPAPNPMLGAGLGPWGRVIEYRDILEKV